jgi:hypothetical protein
MKEDFSDLDLSLQDIYIRELEKNLMERQYYYNKQHWITTGDPCSYSYCTWVKSWRRSARCSHCQKCRCICVCKSSLSTDLLGLMELKKIAFQKKQQMEKK